MRRLVLFSSFAFNPNIEEVDFTIFPYYDDIKHKTMLDQYRSQYAMEIRPLPKNSHIIIEK